MLSTVRGAARVLRSGMHGFGAKMRSVPFRGMAGPAESTDTVCIIDDLSKAIAGRTLFRDLSLSFFHGAKIGILGPNGAGTVARGCGVCAR